MKDGDWRRLVAHVPAALAAVLGTALAIGGCLAVRSAEYDRTRIKAQSLAADRSGTIRREFTEAVARVHALQAFFEASEEITSREFARFLTTSVPASDHDTFFWWPEAGQRAKASHVYPRNGYGIDMEAVRRRDDVVAAMLRARTQHDVVAVGTKGGKRILLLAGSPGGYVGVALLTESVVERAIAYLAPGGMDISVVEPGKRGDDRLLYFHSSRAGGRRREPQSAPAMRFTESLDIAGHKLRLVADTAPHFVESGYSNAGWAILVAGLLSTVACTWWLQDRRGYAARIEQLVERRTRELADARDEALRASKLKSQFLANVSHEIRTPLNGVVGMAEFLLETPLGVQQREFATTIRDSSHALLAIVSDLLDMSRIETGKLVLAREPLDVRHTATVAVAGLQAAARSKGLQLTTEFGSEVPQRVLGDAVRLQQVLVNLLHNAIKFTEAGTVGLRVSLEREASAGPLLRFEVRDTGPGVKPEARELIFRRFVQADGTHARQHGGLGLGLAISRQIVERMHGKLDVESQPGQGSTFWFTALFGRCAEESASPVPEAPPKQEDVLSGPVILLAEDNAVNRKVAAHMLTKLGYAFQVANNGREALEMSEQRAFAAILMDCQMPVVDGFAATAEIRGREGSTRHTPIIALTANAMNGDREHCLAMGMDDYLPKPLEIAMLSAVLQRWTGRIKPGSV
ncbi:MAG: response regulator [Bryobacterales bacterium]|nr:response regulator [Bryobacterales bacterium]